MAHARIHRGLLAPGYLSLLTWADGALAANSRTVEIARSVAARSPAVQDDALPLGRLWAGSRYQVLAVCALLLLAVALVFGQTGRYQFVNIDDNECVYQNPEVTDGLSGHGIKAALTQSQANNWVPLTWISHMLDWQVFGRNAGGHHLTNVLLHAATAVLLFLALTQLTGRMWASALAAALFAVHPSAGGIRGLGNRAEGRAQRGVLRAALWAYGSYARRRFSLPRYAASWCSSPSGSWPSRCS